MDLLSRKWEFFLPACLPLDWDTDFFPLPKMGTTTSALLALGSLDSDYTRTLGCPGSSPYQQTLQVLGGSCDPVP